MSFTLYALASAFAFPMPQGTFDCEIGQVQVLDLAGGRATVSEITAFPAPIRQFQIVFSGNEASVIWPNSPISVSGKQMVLPTGPSSGMIFIFSDGPCLMTGNGCVTLVNFGTQPDGTLKLLLTPTAVSGANESDGTRSPVLVAIQGSCLSRKSS